MRWVIVLAILFSVPCSAQTYNWAFSLGDSSTSQGNALCTDANGNIYTIGYFLRYPDFDPSTSAADLFSNGWRDVYVAKYDEAGNYLWAINLGGVFHDEGWGIGTDGDGNVLITGFFLGTADFDPSGGIGRSPPSKVGQKQKQFIMIMNEVF